MPRHFIQWSCSVLRTVRKQKCLLVLFGLFVVAMQLLDVAPSIGNNHPLMPKYFYQRDSSANDFNAFPSLLDTDTSHDLKSANHHSRHIQGFYRGILEKFESYLPDKLESSKVNLKGQGHGLKHCDNSCIHHKSTNQNLDNSDLTNQIAKIGADLTNQNRDSSDLTNQISKIGAELTNEINQIERVTIPSVFIPSAVRGLPHRDQNNLAQLELFERYYEKHFKSKSELLEFERQGFLHFSYNVTASDRIPINRQIPDTRPASCPVIDPLEVFNDTVTIVIAVHNEAHSVLIRTLTSILLNTNTQLLQQIIVVFDNESDTQYVEEYFKTDGKFVFLHTKQREGLVRSRLLGAKQANGTILVFLDSHCECNKQWLEPLVYSIAQNRRKIVSPYIDSVRPDTFEYVEAPANLQGGFNWNLEFIWQPIPYHKYQQRTSPHQPISTPTISGGLFAVDREYFYQLGSFDDKMDIWGGENLELSFRTWMCGGQLEILPCCRVGHVFRSILPHSFPQGGKQTVSRNLARVAEVWLDDYKHIFYNTLNLSKSMEDVTQRKQLREKLQCHSFSWYLDNIVPELSVPDYTSHAFGEFRHQMSLRCLTVQSNGRIVLAACQGQNNAQQMFSLSFHGDLKQNRNNKSSNADSKDCLVNIEDEIRFGSCGQQFWKLQGNQIKLEESEMCLGSEDYERPTLVSCDQRKETIWDISYRFSKPWKH